MTGIRLNNPDSRSKELIYNDEKIQKGSSKYEEERGKGTLEDCWTSTHLSSLRKRLSRNEFGNWTLWKSKLSNRSFWRSSSPSIRAGERKQASSSRNLEQFMNKLIIPQYFSHVFVFHSPSKKLSFAVSREVYLLSKFLIIWNDEFKDIPYVSSDDPFEKILSLKVQVRCGVGNCWILLKPWLGSFQSLHWFGWLTGEFGMLRLDSKLFKILN